MDNLQTYVRVTALEKLRFAELALEETRDLLSDEANPLGLGIGLALVNRIRTAEKRVADALDALRKVDASYMN